VDDMSFDRAVRSNISENSINFILEDESIFNDVGYKVLQNQRKYGLIKCAKLSQNGKIKLVYDITGYKPLSAMLPRINQQNFMLIVSRLYDIVKHIQENGFIRCENVILGADKIFIDSEDLSVHLICLPINNISRYQNIQLFFEDLKQIVLTAASVYPALPGQEVLKLINASRDDRSSFDEKKTRDPAKPAGSSNSSEHEKESHHHSNASGTPKKSEPKSTWNKTGAITVIVLYQIAIIGALVYAYYNVDDITYYIFFALGLDVLLSIITYGLFSRKRDKAGADLKMTSALVLASTNSKDIIRFVVNKPVFLIGKQAGTVDGVIPNEKTVSRVHCKIIRKGKKYYIQDMGSMNGTYVNNRRIEEGQQVPINRGDVIRLSKLEFIIE